MTMIWSPTNGFILRGEPAENLYLVALGKVKLVRNSLSGREALLDILRGGEYFSALAAFGERTYMESAIAQTDGCILQISAEIIQQLSAQSVEQRIASALLRLAGKWGEARGQEVLIQLPFLR